MLLSPNVRRKSGAMAPLLFYNPILLFHQKQNRKINEKFIINYLVDKLTISLVKALVFTVEFNALKALIQVLNFYPENTGISYPVFNIIILF